MTGFVIEFVVERDVIVEDRYLLDTLSGNTGIQILLNRASNGSEGIVRIGDGSTIVESVFTMDNNPHHGIVECTPTDVTVVIDGVAGTTTAVVMVPSGRNFADSTQASPIGALPMMKLWFGENYTEYDRATSLVEGQAVIANYEGWGDKGLIDTQSFTYEPANGDRLIENEGTL